MTTRRIQPFLLGSALLLAMASSPGAGATPLMTDIAVSGVADSNPVIAGGQLTYTFTVENLGAEKAEDVELTLDFDDDVTFVSSSGCIFDPDGAPLCRLQSVGPGLSKQASFLVTVDEGVRGLLVTTGDVATNTSDTNAGNNSATVRTAVRVEMVVAEGSSPSIASDPADSESFAIVWQGNGPGLGPPPGHGNSFAGGDGVFSRLFDATGMPIGIEMRLDSSGTTHSSTDVAHTGDGTYVAAWQSEDAEDTGVFARRFDLTGMPIGIEMQLNATTGGAQSQPSVAATGDGGFVVAWSDEESLGSFVRALRRFDATGMPIGIEMRFGASDIDAKPPAAAASSGRILVTWEDAADRIAAQLFDLTGMPIGIELQVAGSGQNAEPSVAARQDGFLVVWQDQTGLDSDGDGIFARRLDLTGMPIGIEMQLNATATGDQQRPMITRAPDGTFAVTWQGPDEDGTGIYARRLGLTGMPIGIELSLGQSADGDQTSAEPAFVKEDTFYVTWESDEEGDSEILTGPPSQLFFDGFESGDLSSWSSSAGL